MSELPEQENLRLEKLGWRVALEEAAQYAREPSHFIYAHARWNRAVMIGRAIRAAGYEIHTISKQRRKEIAAQALQQVKYPGSEKERSMEQAHMTEEQYLKEVLRTCQTGPEDETHPLHRLVLGALGLAGEAGEIVDLIKKHAFQGHIFDDDQMCEELGDLLWYFMLLCYQCDLTVAEVMQRNVEKLRKRYPDGFDPQRSMNR